MHSFVLCRTRGRGESYTVRFVFCAVQHTHTSRLTSLVLSSGFFRLSYPQLIHCVRWHRRHWLSRRVWCRGASESGGRRCGSLCCSDDYSVDSEPCLSTFRLVLTLSCGSRRWCLTPQPRSSTPTPRCEDRGDDPSDIYGRRKQSRS